MRVKHTFRLPPGLGKRLAEYALRRRISQALVVEAALESFLSPDGAEQLEAALSRRLDRLSRQADRIEQVVGIILEALGLFVRFWLANTLALPEASLAAQQAKGRERYQNFLTSLGRRIAKGANLSRDIEASAREADAPEI
ncbi:CopG family transcriptional regulator [uncultured Caulobacter sp.]|uniref:CopG family transcriptional regulator n=1 Tax=uncultured Caulobacter sp. TaxID=158749 RepID=UPI00260AF34B|nr:CopG family transcriptional regulator [uncultured Caulobacter sp.]